jgi:hypothetical protein
MYMKAQVEEALYRDRARLLTLINASFLIRGSAGEEK